MNMSTSHHEEELDRYVGLGDRVTVDTSEGQPVYLLAARNMAYIRLSPSAYQLLRWREDGKSFEEMAALVAGGDGGPTTAEDVRVAYRTIVERIIAIEGKERGMGRGFLFALPLFRERFVRTIADRLARAYNPVFGGLALTSIFVALLSSLIGRGPINFDPAVFWKAYLLLLGSLIVHEFGHASACARFGAKPSEIGFTVYLIYPAFYSDVSSAWALKRWQRVVVDLGGMYFQLLVGAIYALAYMAFGWEPFRLAVIMVLGTCFFSLNPIFRFDGYWVIADSLGVTNLGEQPGRILRHLYRRLRKRPVDPLPWSKLVAYALIPYTFATFAFWGYFVARLTPAIWKALQAYPKSVSTMVKHLATSSVGAHKAELLSLLMTTFMLVLTLLMAARMLSPLLQSLRSLPWFHRQRQDSLRRPIESNP